MLKIGITGGIGSGKSIVCKAFSHLDVPVFSADITAKMLAEHDTAAIDAITRLFGKKAYVRGRYNRAYIAEKVFTDYSLLQQLNDILHPLVARDFIAWAGKHSASPYVLHEAAILFESGADQAMDFTLVVDAPVELRIRRIMRRDKIKRDKVEQRMKNQWPTDKIRQLADWTIQNDDKTLILPQILDIDKQLKKISLAHG